MDHLAPAEHGIHRVEDLGLAVEPARRRRSEHLVPAEAQEIHIQLLHVDPMVRRELRGIHAHDRADRVGGLDQLLQRGDRAQRVRHARHRQDLRALGQERSQVREIQLTVVRQRDVAERGPGDGRGHLPRHDVRVMLHLRDEDLVALVQELPSPALRHEVEGFGDAPREHDRLGTRCTEEPREVRARALEQLGGLLAQHVEAAVGVRVVVRVEVGLRVDHLLRLLRRRGAVQVDHGPIAHRAREDREVLADLLDVQPSDVPRHVRLRIKPRRSRPLPVPARRGRLRTPWPRAPSRARDRRSSRYDPSSSRGPCRA